ncbi:phosphoadenosine phosphosulfate reductase [Desulfocurvibacter africanus]|uniref:phosphoadenosine phosphosulfate reductase n=1 Tax=Desulfocurvibacter africanus TaxID=873 RepID=UPI000420D79C|nr:phosphoadenosine phosphosulfate reductase [Desulfocurvibacter africanus]
MATKAGHHYGGKPVTPEAQEQLRMLRELPLEAKIERSLQVISCWYEAWDGKVAVSYSGGKDSELVRWLVGQVFKDVPAVCVNTGLEYPEVLRRARESGAIMLRPKMPFHKVIQDYGWPLISKRVARGINILRNPTSANANVYRLYDEGINRFGEPVARFRVPNRWRFLVTAPFPVSDECCNLMKKAPIKPWQRETGRMPILGIVASDSDAREKNYLQHGCNAYDLKNPRSTPLGFWTEQDVLACIRKYKIQIANVYGDIVEDESGQLSTTGVRNTGCVFCGFGLHMDETPTRFQRMAETHPRLWEFCMHKLGMLQVLDYCRAHVPSAAVSERFNPWPAQVKAEQCSLLGVCA